jgi:flagellar basal-body rod modification protein FlgD
MTTGVDSNNSPNPYASLGLAVQKGSGSDSSGNGSLNQADFLKLLTTQLKNQDPTKPMDNTAFVAQMAQFSSVQGINDLNKTVQGFQSTLQANQVMQAASLVGKAAMVKGDTAHLYHQKASDGSMQPSGILGAVDVPTGATQMTVKIAAPNGQVVKTIDVPVKSDGSRASFAWDGKLPDGSVAPEGNYTVTANATVSGKGQAAQTYVGAVIQSVGVSSNGPQINLDGLGSAKLSDIVGILN